MKHDQEQVVQHAYRPQNRIRQALKRHQFFWTVEFVASSDHVLSDDLVQIDAFVRKLARRPELAGFSVTDRVHSDDDPDPVLIGKHVRDHAGTQPLIHLSGKDREIDDFLKSLARLRDHKLENVLLLSGDKLKSPPTDRRPRYLESVPAIQLARAHSPDLLIAAALNPFKYREEEAMAQYLKLGKKIHAGADFVITQIGFDMLKHEEALFWMESRGYRIPMVANIMALSAARARYIRNHQLAGVTITDSLHALLESEEAELTKEQASARITRRLALQIVGLRLIGYSGVQLTALHDTATLQTLLHQVDYLTEKCPDRVSWNRAWRDAFIFPDGKRRANPAPEDGWCLSDPRQHHTPLRDRLTQASMAPLHDWFFEDGFPAQILRRLLGNITRHSHADQRLLTWEKRIKKPLFGCESCGSCRLPATQYICPETCPKGLANGPCGGTQTNTCEFGDRECIHSRKYRVARDQQQLDALEDWLIPAISPEIRGSSSFPPAWRRDGPEIKKPD